jgi:DNA-binding LacI/PurR family transcriptional regulator
MRVMFDNKISLYVQVKNDLIRRIRSGDMLPNTKVPSERVLAETFGISRGTAKQALQELEMEKYIERIPAKGSFVRDISEGTLKHINILFPFPEKSIYNLLEYANSIAVTEIYRGMMSACNKYNIRLSFQYFPITDNIEMLREQTREVQEFAGAIFLGHQLEKLRFELQKYGIPFVAIHTDDSLNIPRTTVSYNRSEIIAESAGILVDAGYKSAGMLTNLGGDESKANICGSVFAARGVEFHSDWILKLENDEEKAYSRLKELLPDNLELLPEVFFCGSPVYSFALLGLAAERNWKVPDDIAVFGYAHDMNIRPTVPLLSHVYVPYFEMGEEACRVLANGLRGEFVVPARIVQGKTVSQLECE